MSALRLSRLVTSALGPYQALLDADLPGLASAWWSLVGVSWRVAHRLGWPI